MPILYFQALEYYCFHNYTNSLTGQAHRKSVIITDHLLGILLSPIMAEKHTGVSPLRIAVGSDSAGYAYKTALKAELERNAGVSEVLDVGVVSAEDSTAYPHLAVDAGKKIMAGEVKCFAQSS